MKIAQALLCGLLGCLLSSVIYASNYSFMNYSAISYFNDKDLAMMSANIENTLDHTPDGKKSSWKNPNSSANGYAIPSRTTKQNNTICRQLKIFNEAKMVTGVANYQFCKMNGKWKINNN